MTEPFPPAPSRRPIFIAWTIILLIVAFLILATSKPEIRGREVSTAPTEVQLNILAKTAVGMHAISPKTPVATVLQPIDKLAEMPRQKLEAAIISAELEGRDAALKRLDSLDSPQLADNLKKDLHDLRTIYTLSPDSLDAAARDRLTSEYNFFGNVALSFSKPDSD